MTSALPGKVAVVTGCSRGFGYAAAQALLEEGAAVVISSRSSSAVQSAVENLRTVGEQVAGQQADGPIWTRSERWLTTR
jgi:3-oxoacyl-[acyl-carrier protein] reductase